MFWGALNCGGVGWQRFCVLVCEWCCGWRGRICNGVEEGNGQCGTLVWCDALWAESGWMQEDGRVKCWGQNSNGQLGTGHQESIGNHMDDMGASTRPPAARELLFLLSRACGVEAGGGCKGREGDGRVWGACRRSWPRWTWTGGLWQSRRDCTTPARCWCVGGVWLRVA